MILSAMSDGHADANRSSAASSFSTIHASKEYLCFSIFPDSTPVATGIRMSHPPWKAETCSFSMRVS